MKRNILFLSLLSFGQFLLVHFFLIQGFPNSGDEQAYLYQARLLSRGQLYVEDPIYDRANPLNKYVEANTRWTTPPAVVFRNTIRAGRPCFR